DGSADHRYLHSFPTRRSSDLAGNVLSALAPSIEWLIVARFLTGLPHGCYFGAGVVAGAHLVGKSKTGRAVSLILLGLTVANIIRSEEHTSELQSRENLVCRLL